MDDFEKLVTDISAKNVAFFQKKSAQKDWHDNRFNYINTVIAILALIVAIISLVLQL